jgi:hypothetical protein
VNGILTQTGALILDGYRDLNSRKLFWISLAISALVVGSLGALGMNPTGYSIFWWSFPSTALNSRVLPPNLVYKYAIVMFAIPIWLAWGATILALVSTASIIPDFVTGGAIELTLSKPISRLRLLATKYATALFFTALQATVFSVACFLLVGIRGHSWEPRLFMAIPLMILFFSYLYCVCTLLGLVTRSVVASLLLTVLFWLALAGVNGAEEGFLFYREYNRMQMQRVEARIESDKAKLVKNDEALASITDESKRAPVVSARELLLGQIDRQTSQLESLRGTARWVGPTYAAVYWTKFTLPKTRETVRLMERGLLSSEDIERFQPEDAPQNFSISGDDVPVNTRQLGRKVQGMLRSRSLSWIIGTSLAFQAVVLLVAVRIFSRRDF